MSEWVTKPIRDESGVVEEYYFQKGSLNGDADPSCVEHLHISICRVREIEPTYFIHIHNLDEGVDNRKKVGTINYRSEKYFSNIEDLLKDAHNRFYNLPHITDIRHISSTNRVLYELRQFGNNQ